MYVSCVHPVAVLNAAFCMTCSLLMLVEDARGDHMEEASSRSGLMSASCLSRFSVRLFSFIQATTLCRYCCMYLLTALEGFSSLPELVLLVVVYLQCIC